MQPIAVKQVDPLFPQLSFQMITLLQCPLAVTQQVHFCMFHMLIPVMAARAQVSVHSVCTCIHTYFTCVHYLWSAAARRKPYALTIILPLTCIISSEKGLDSTTVKA